MKLNNSIQSKKKSKKKKYTKETFLFKKIVMKKFSFGISFRSNYLQTDLHSAFMKNCRVDEKFSKPCCIVPPPFNYLQRIYEHSGKKIHIGKNFYKLVSPRTLERYHLISINISTNHHRRNYLERRINLKIIIHYNIENSNREKKISKISSRSTNPTTRISRSNRIEAEKMDGSAHLFQFQLVWGNNEKSGSAISRQFGNNALDRGAISRFRIHESMEEVCACACEKERERKNRTWKKRKIGSIETNRLRNVQSCMVEQPCSITQFYWMARFPWTTTTFL